MVLIMVNINIIIMVNINGIIFNGINFCSTIFGL